MFGIWESSVNDASKSDERERRGEEEGVREVQSECGGGGAKEGERDYEAETLLCYSLSNCDKGTRTYIHTHMHKAIGSFLHSCDRKHPRKQGRIYFASNFQRL